MQRRDLLALCAALPFGIARARATETARGTPPGTPSGTPPGTPTVFHTDAEWRAMLTPAQYGVLRQQGTEPPFSSPLDHETRAGRYACRGCDLPAFASSTKFDSGTGWPSFWEKLPHAVVTRDDSSFGMQRTEVHCVRCESHLGHLFDDGPRPTGLRYCMNGVALRFTPDGGTSS